jgi:hypothetical protein
MPRSPIKRNARVLSEAARDERDPKKFVFLLKQLYDVVNDPRTIQKDSSHGGIRHARKAA